MIQNTFTLNEIIQGCCGSSLFKLLLYKVCIMNDSPVNRSYNTLCTPSSLFNFLLLVEKLKLQIVYIFQLTCFNQQMFDLIPG